MPNPFDLTELFQTAKRYAQNPQLVLAMIAKFVADYCDDHQVDRELVCRMIRDCPRPPIDVRGENGVV